VRVGLECCLEDPQQVIGSARFGLLMHQASVDAGLHYACDRLAEALPGQLAAIFSPQHGLWGEQQANMDETPHGVHPRWKIPVHSLYSETRRPTPEMLDGLELFVIDLQDVGTRVYTYIWTVVYCLEACAEVGLPVVLLDRPNPVGGLVVEGPILQTGFTSFVGLLPIPMRHGLTLGELACLANQERNLGAKLEVVRMRGWRRKMLFSETGRPWVSPSPNIPRFFTTLLYPGQVLLEGTVLSEGRGTTQPFELAGAPFVDPDALAGALRQYELPGLGIRPVYFRPTFEKWAGTRCGGVALHVLQPRDVRSYATTLALLASVRRLWPQPELWRMPPYEYEFDRMPIDILHGCSDLRLRLDQPISDPPRLDDLAAVDHQQWWSRVEPFLLYD
jgi:uncharacterized protein YbbC (DUF1343 family)